jgi:hypothetical protein
MPDIIIQVASAVVACLGFLTGLHFVSAVKRTGLAKIAASSLIGLSLLFSGGAGAALAANFSSLSLKLAAPVAILFILSICLTARGGYIMGDLAGHVLDASTFRNMIPEIAEEEEHEASTLNNLIFETNAPVFSFKNDGANYISEEGQTDLLDYNNNAPKFDL